MTIGSTAPPLDFHNATLLQKEQEECQQAQEEKAINEIVTSWEETFRRHVIDAYYQGSSMEEATEKALRLMADTC